MTIEPQHERARALANEVRRLRSDLRREVALCDPDGGRALLADMIHSGYAQRDDIRLALRNAYAVDCVRWVHKMPSASADRYVVAVGASPVRKMGELTDRQRGALAGLLLGGLSALRRAEEENALELWRRAHPGDVAA